MAIPARHKKQTGAIIIGGNFQGLGLLRSLGKQGIPVYLLDHELCIGRFSRYTDKFLKCPDVRKESTFLQFLMDLAKKENLTGWLIYPNDDETVCFLARYKSQLEEYYRITTQSWDVVKFAYEKKLTYKLAERCGIPIPKTFYPGNIDELQQLDLEFPVIIKPSIKEPFFSKTKKKAIQVDCRSKLEEEYLRLTRLVGDSQTIMIQELITGGAKNLYSVGSLFSNGDLLAKVVVRRPRQHPMNFGRATTYAETLEIPELEEMTRTILAKIGYRGLSEVEFMMDPKDGKYKLLEINARAWGWHTISIGAGVDLPYLSYLDMLGESVKRNGFMPGVNWIRMVTDIPTAFGELVRGRMSFSDYIDSLKGKKQFAVWSVKDPLPFLAELLILPYLWKRRGF